MLAIIDGDVLAYQACYFIWEERLRAANKIKDDVLFIELDDEGQKKPFEFPKEVDRVYLEKAYKNFKDMLKDLLDKVYATDYLMAVKGDGNFRNLLYPDYKRNRHASPDKQNVFVPVIRKLSVHEGLSVSSYGREADDLIRMWSIQAREAGDPFVICSIDKDLKCIPGTHYMMNTKTAIEVSEEHARKHYYMQLLRGDMTDNIPGIPRVGEIKAFKLIDCCQSEEECQEAVVNAYMEYYGDLWLNAFLSNAKMIHLQTHENDYFEIEKWPILVELLR